jgi:hypothetical protein
MAPLEHRDQHDVKATREQDKKVSAPKAAFENQFFQHKRSPDS